MSTFELADAIVVIGHSLEWQQWLDRLPLLEQVVFVEEPDVIAASNVQRRISQARRPPLLIEWEYLRPTAADEFAIRFAGPMPACVVPGTEYAVPFAARLAERFGLPGGSYGAARLLRDKSKMRQVSAAAGIANPVSRSVREPGEVRAFAQEHGLPVIIKPANRQGAVGTKIVRDLAGIESAWHDCLDQDEAGRLPDRQLPLSMLAETFVRGIEWSVEMLFDCGEPVFTNVTEKIMCSGDRPVELGHIVPARVPAQDAAAMIAETRRIVDAFAFDSGMIHCEWIMPESGPPHLVECAGRMPGDMVVPMMNYVYQYDVARALLNVLQGKHPPTPPQEKPAESACVQFKMAAPGQVTLIKGLEEAQGSPGVVYATVYPRVGDLVQQLRSSHDRVASVIATAPTATQAADLAGRALGLIAVETVPR